MSSVLDEEPKKKAKRRKSTSVGPGKAEPGKKAKKEDKPADPDQDEIKRLQGWLVKCGIRKMWFKELAPYETPKAKIKHLKQMLSDAGMTGRPSQEKANNIREARELKADLEAVQEGAQMWGKHETKDDLAEGGPRPKRQVAKALAGLEFLGSDDGEETD